jgi:hypothetical protein
LDKNVPTNFKKQDIGIPAGSTKNIYLEGECETGKDYGSVINFDVHGRNDPRKEAVFRIEIPTVNGHCRARYFKVDDQYRKAQYRKIELAPIRFVSPRTTPTPHLRFTINEEGNSVIFLQEGPQASSFK